MASSVSVLMEFDCTWTGYNVYIIIYNVFSYYHMIVTGKIISAQVTKAGKARLRIHQSLLPKTDKHPLSVLSGLILEQIYKVFIQTDRTVC